MAIKDKIASICDRLKGHKTVDRFVRELKYYMNPRTDMNGEAETIAQIKSGIEFRGSNLWVLIFAILVASLGLNINSTAVIIGAMLISPLMGPILGMGLGFGINDQKLLRESFKSYLIAVGISVVTATLYFWISPISTAQSELLSRTNPTIYDVMIAFFGGAAGIVGVCTKGKDNVITGVAIATALMPPLCTAGYGIATLNARFFLGAFYLFIINTVFICLATALGVRVMKFSRNEGAERSRKVRNATSIILVIILIPATLLTINIIRKSVQEGNASHFVNEQLASDRTRILSTQVDSENKIIQVLAIGAEISQKDIKIAEERLKDYNLENYSLNLIQGTQSDSIYTASLSKVKTEADQKLLAQSTQMSLLGKQLQEYLSLETLGTDINAELHSLFPQIESFTLAKVLDNSSENPEHQQVAFVSMKEGTEQKTWTDAEKNRFELWLKTRCKNQNLVVKYICN